MTGPDVPRSIAEFEKFVTATDQVVNENRPRTGVVDLGTHQRQPDKVVAELSQVTKKILDRVLRESRGADDTPAELRYEARSNHLRDWAGHGSAALEHEEELREKLGDHAPSISVCIPHPWVWSGVRSPWQSLSVLARWVVESTLETT